MFQGVGEHCAPADPEQAKEFFLRVIKLERRIIAGLTAIVLLSLPTFVTLGLVLLDVLSGVQDDLTEIRRAVAVLQVELPEEASERLMLLEHVVFEGGAIDTLLRPTAPGAPATIKREREGE